MVGSIFDFFRGQLKIKLISNAPERFLNICNSNEIFIWNLVRDNDDYCFNILPKDYFKLKNILKKTNSKTIILEKNGIAFTMFRYRKHNCFLAGIMLAFFMIYLISLFVWDISVEGNTMITDDVILDALEIYGIKHGDFKNNIVCDDLEKYLRNNFNDMTWVSAEIDGTRLTIYVKENDEDFVNVQNMSVCDLVATKSGVVSAIVTRSGTPMVKVGDAVEAGDILVSGIVDIIDDYGNVISSKQVRSDADISISTRYDYNEVLQKEYKYKLFTGKNATHLYVKILDATVRLGLSVAYEESETVFLDSQIKLTENFWLPVHYGKIQYKEYIEEAAFYTKSQAEDILSERLQYFLTDLEEKGVQIIGKDVKMYENDFEYTYSGTIDVIEPAYIQTEIIVADDNIGEVNERN